jgi:hypothetical protein
VITSGEAGWLAGDLLLKLNAAACSGVLGGYKQTTAKKVESGE